MTGTSAAVSDLLALLEAERRLILDGQLMALGPLQDDKARLVGRIVPGTVPAGAMARLRGLAASNLALLAAARAGLAAAQARLRELERLGQGGASYDSHGARRDDLSGSSRPRTLRRV